MPILNEVHNEKHLLAIRNSVTVYGCKSLIFFFFWKSKSVILFANYSVEHNVWILMYDS